MANLDKFRSVNLKLDEANAYDIKTQFAKQGDYNGRVLYVQVTNGGEVSSQTEVSLNLGWQHATEKNQGLDPFELVDEDKGIFKIAYPAEMLHPGTVICAIQIVESDKITVTRNFKLEVEKSPFDDETVVSSNSFTALQKALMRVEDIELSEQERQDTFEANETKRQTTFEKSESDRGSTFKSNESERQAEFDSNEQTRQSNEDTRISNENARKTAESHRATAESNRETAEDARKSQESSRVSAETARKNAETARVSAEDTRKNNENNRIALYNDMENKLQSGYFKGEKGNKGDKGDKGDKGNKGDPGEVSKAMLDAAVNPIKAKTDVYTVSGDTVDFKKGVSLKGLSLEAAVIVESGKNANGYYVRFGDGTQICWKDTFNLTYNNKYSLSNTWTFPAAFKDTHYVMGGMLEYTNSNYKGATIEIDGGGKSTTAVALLLTTDELIGRVYKSGFNTDIDILCIGRWK